MDDYVPSLPPPPHAMLAAGLCTLLLAAPAMALDAAKIHELFAQPPREYTTAPLWVWNDLLTDEQIISSLRDLAGQNVRQVFVHPRPGLMTPYLSAEWMRLWKVAIQEAERLDMNVWIYDENSYPSGFAGGLVPEAMPASRGLGLAADEHKIPPAWTDDTLAVFSLLEDRYEDVTARVRSGQGVPEGRYLVFSLRRAPSSGWYGGQWYVDLLRPGVTEKFLEVTMEAYRREVGDQFGKRIPGVFTDEPHVRPAGGLPWSQDLPQRFEKRWGYRLTDHLPGLTLPLGDWKRLRHNYLQWLNEEFINHWARPYYDYCEKHGIEFTGHYWEHEWPLCLQVPDNMAMSAWQHRPGIDTLMNNYAEDPHAQFGNVRAVKELASVAHQLGRNRTLCEAYGAGGWDLRFEDMKRIGDWLYVLGVNTLDEHLSYVTLRGARKRDHPQSFSYHEPWWRAYQVCATYFARLSVAMSAGGEINRILVMEPTTTAWMYNSPGGAPPELEQLGRTFQQLVTDLAKAQVEFDLGCEDIIARHGSVAGAALRVGRRDYGTVVLPPVTENLNAKTIELLAQVLEAGGTVLSCGEPPARIDGSASDRGRSLTGKPGWKAVKVEDLASMLLRAAADGFAVRPAEGNKGILFHHRRHLDDGDLVLLVNTSLREPASGHVESAAGGAERWDPHTAERSAVRFERMDRGIRVPFELPPSGSLLLFLSAQARDPAPAVSEATATIAPAGPVEIRPVEPNVLTLDYVDITAGGQTRSSLSVLRASDFVFQKNGLERNPWNSAVQLRDEWIARKFPAGSGFEATYRFTIEDRVPDSLFAVIERGDLYTITCNGKPVSAKKEAWWLDKAFSQIGIAAAAQVGENAISIKASSMTMFHEVEAAFIVGDFALKPGDKGFVIVPPQSLTLGPWNEQGLPFYAHGVSYRQRYQIADRKGRYLVTLPAWYGSVAEVLVNGRPAGHIWHPPWQCDVTDRIVPGTCKVEVIVIGTLKNTLGPHHGSPPLGTAWPGMWNNAPEQGPPPGKSYATVGYGLFEPFVLKQVTP